VLKLAITEDIQRLEPGELITLYELDAANIGGEVLRFHAHTQSASIWWQGEEFKPWAVEADGIGRSGEGQRPSPTLSVGNIGPDEDGVNRSGVISALCIYLHDLVGARLKVHQTLGKFLDALNFPDGNPSANPDEHLPLEVWIVEQKTEETPEVVSFMLSSPLDFDGKQLPRRPIVAGTCPWLWIGGYRGHYCQYTGSNYFDKDDNPVSDPALDRCGGRPNSCQRRWGEWQPITFGGFPSSDLVRA